MRRNGDVNVRVAFGGFADGGDGGGVVGVDADEEVAVGVAEPGDVVVDHLLDDLALTPERHEDGHRARRDGVEFLFGRGPVVWMAREFPLNVGENGGDSDDQFIEAVEENPEGEGREEACNPMIQRQLAFGLLPAVVGRGGFSLSIFCVKLKPLGHAFAQGGDGAGGGEEVGDDGEGVGAGVEADCGVASGDASDGDERPGGQGTDGAQAFDSDGGIGAVFGSRGEDRAEGYVVDRLGCGGAHLIGIVGGEADEGVGADDGAGVGGEEVVLPQVQGGVQQAGVIGAVVDYEERVGVPAEGGDFAGLGEDFTAPEGFVTELEDSGAAFEQRRGGVDRMEIEAAEGGCVEDGVDAGELQG